MSDEAAPSEKPKRVPRTWPQRLTIVVAFACALASFAAAGVLYAGQRVVEDRNIAPEIVDPSQNAALGFDVSGEATSEGTGDESDPPGPTATFPPAEPDAKNFLITGADNNSCIDADSPYAPAFGDRSSFGERSDTIMMWRINPETSQVAVLSFPRDLWVTISGRSSKQRINVAYDRDDPQKLIDTIYENFGINTDHFIQVDFCAFKTLVNAVDGVAVPFDTPVRDVATGLNVPEAGCFTFDGDHALAYVRSRKLQTFNEDGEWVTDPTSDLGRISRQQDFLRRTVSRLLSKGALNPDVAGALIETSSEYIVADERLTLKKELEFAGVLSRVDPTQITTYQIEAAPDTIQGNAVLVPRINGDNMQAILAIFRGEAILGEIIEQVFETTVPDTESPATTAATDNGSSDDDIATVTTLPTVQADENDKGVVPDDTIVCA
jgi:LCP family protein required for cell wall assembly